MRSWIRFGGRPALALALAVCLAGASPSEARDADPGAALDEAIEAYRLIVEEGGWEPIPSGATLDPGDRSPRVELLRRRLQTSGHLSATASDPGDPQLYDDALEAAVREFQRTHGLEVDARVGPATLVQLNVSAARRLEQLIVNRERQRTFTDEPGDHYIFVNVPDFRVHVVDHGEESFRLRAIVGQPGRPTPIFAARMTYLVLSPYWHVPPGIAARDQFPRIQADLGHLERERLVLLEQATGRRVDPSSVQWSAMTGSEFNARFRLRQEPGAHNAMGHVKFMFPNRHNVYLHDTPNRELFNQARRALSSGCVRIERPLELAEHLLSADPRWTRDRIDEVIELGVERHVPLTTAYEVHIEYWTAFVDEAGTLHFREDIYNRDGPAFTALEDGETIRTLAWRTGPDPLGPEGSCPVPAFGLPVGLG